MKKKYIKPKIKTDKKSFLALFYRDRNLDSSMEDLLMDKYLIAYSCSPTFSDIRLKKNVQSTKNVLNTLTKIKTVTFNWKKEGLHLGLANKKNFGFVAQDVLKYFPDMIDMNNQERLSVDYHQFIPLLLQGLRELDQKYQKVSHELRSLKEKLSK